MLQTRVGRCRAAAVSLSASLLAVAPAHAGVRSLPVEPTTSRGYDVAGEHAVLTARVHIPRGTVRVIEGFGLAWRGPAPKPRCRPLVIVTAGASPNRARALRGLKDLGHSQVTLRTPSDTPTVKGQMLGDQDPRFGAVRVVRFDLPADVLPAYPRRAITLTATTLALPARCAAQTAQAERVVRTALRELTVEVPATYTPPPPLNPPQPIDLAATPGLLLKGGASSDRAGTQLAAAGDVNGDGLADAVVSSPGAGPRDAGTATVVFGHAGGGVLDLGRIGPAGFQIRGPAAESFALPATGIGDLDGDGLDDLLVGAPAAAGGRGAGYVIRGSADSTPVDLAHPGNRLLLKVVGGRPCSQPVDPGSGDNLGGDVAGPGDVNGDGVPDLALLAPGNCFQGARGAVYVVFGKRGGGTVDVRRLGAAGITVPGAVPAQLSGAGIAAVGDVNGDGLGDVALERHDGGPDLPLAAIVLGRRSGGTTSQSALRFTVDGLACDDGHATAAAGDVNGDGLGDLVVAGGSPDCAGGIGQAYVVFGSPTPAPVKVRELGARGITIGGLPGLAFASGVAGAGDVNGDGLADVAIGAEDARVFARRLAGEVFLVYGRRDTNQIDLRYGGDGSARAWAGAEQVDSFGTSLAGIGDFDGDGRPDLLAGAPFHGPEAGAAYVLPMP